MALFKNKKADDTAQTAHTAADGNARVKVLGSGCAKCNQLEASVKEAMTALGLEPTVDHVTDFKQIAAYGVMTTPALVVDGKVVSAGKVLKADEAQKLLETLKS